jgi:hypothetical protein
LWKTFKNDNLGLWKLRKPADPDAVPLNFENHDPNGENVSPRAIRVLLTTSGEPYWKPDTDAVDTLKGIKRLLR